MDTSNLKPDLSNLIRGSENPPVMFWLAIGVGVAVALYLLIDWILGMRRRSREFDEEMREAGRTHRPSLYRRFLISIFYRRY